MECVTAQQVISTALDREPVDRYQLEEAKDHCRTCPECGVFVRAQLVTQQVPLPEPSADLVDRVMVRVRAEAAEKQAAQAAAALGAADASAAAKAAAAAAALPPTPAATLAPKQRTPRKLPRIWVSAAAAAAVLVALIGTGSVVIFGMRQMSVQTAPSTQIYENKAITGGAAPEAADSGASAGVRSIEATGAKSITVNGIVYKQVGAATVDTSTAVVVGSTTTAITDGDETRKRDVWARSTAADTVYVVDDAGAQFEFGRVTREYAGLTFVLTAPELTGLDQWPALPTQITPPTSQDGAPTFVYDGTDASGTKIYRLTNATITQGIGVAPDSPQGDPGGGNPNWTWWAILR